MRCVFCVRRSSGGRLVFCFFFLVARSIVWRDAAGLRSSGLCKSYLHASAMKCLGTMCSTLFDVLMRRM